MSSLKQTITNVLEIDAKYRVEGVTGDLYALQDIDVQKRWDYSLPTLIAPRSEEPKRIQMNRRGVSEALFTSVPILSGIDLQNICIAGGSVSSLLLDGRLSSGQDIDMFVYGLDEGTANERIQQLTSDLINQYKQKDKYYYRREPQAVRNDYTLTLDIGDWKFQIIFRLYHSVSEILHGFDLGSSAVGLVADGQELEVYFTTLSKFCYEHCVNILDNTRRSATYEKRLEKYCKRGFSIVLPNMNVNGLSRVHLKYGKSDICELPYLVFSYKDLSGNRIFVEEFLAVGPNHTDPDAREHDYGDDRNGFTSFHSNLYNILHGRENLYYYASGDYIMRIFSGPPNITKGHVEDFYGKLTERIYKDGKFSVRDLERYLPEYEPEAAFRDIVINSDYEPLEESITQHKERVFKRLEELKERPIPWIHKDPGTQLVGSFSPITTTDVEWYGPHYKTNKPQLPVVTVE